MDERWRDALGWLWAAILIAIVIALAIPWFDGKPDAQMLWMK